LFLLFQLLTTYKPAFWYWEVVECLRKLTLTGVFVVVFRGSLLQITLAVLLMASFTLALCHLRPYAEEDPSGGSRTNALAVVTNAQLVVVFLMSLVLQKATLIPPHGSSSDPLVGMGDDALGVVLIATCASTIVLLGYMVVVDGRKHFSDDGDLATTTNEADTQPAAAATAAVDEPARAAVVIARQEARAAAVEIALAESALGQREKQLEQEEAAKRAESAKAVAAVAAVSDEMKRSTEQGLLQAHEKLFAPKRAALVAEREALLAAVAATGVSNVKAAGEQEPKMRKEARIVPSKHVSKMSKVII
jgi:hypothetical protein